MTENLADGSRKFTAAEIRAAMDADPAHRLMKILGQLEDVEGLIHVLYRSSCYVADVDNQNAIFEIGICEGGDMALLNVMSNSLKSIYKEIDAIQSQLPKNGYMECLTTTAST